MGYAQYYSTLMRTVTLHTIHVPIGALENYAKSNNNYNKVVNRTLMGNRGVMERTKVAIIFTNIRTSRSTYNLLYDKSHSKTQHNYYSIFNIFANFGFTN